MPLSRSRRRPLATPVALVATLLALVTAVSACGFNYATDEIYNASAGVNYRASTVDVLGAVIVSAQDGSGTFIATFSNGTVDSTETVKDITAGAADQTTTVTGFEPLTLKPSAFVNLADDPSVVVTGDFAAGGYVTLKIDFETAADVELSVPVVAASYQYAGLDVSGTGAPTDTPSQ